MVVHGSARAAVEPAHRREDRRRRRWRYLKQPEWHDFGPTFASEQLAKRHQIQVSKETVRQWMIEAGLWQSQGAEA